MPRINIEDRLFKDQRFYDLSVALGSREMALGSLIMAWDLAQRYWVSANDRLIPLNEWNRLKHSDVILSVGFAERKEDKIYLKGSQEQFQWLIQRQEAGRKNKGKKRKRPLTGVNGSNRLESSSSSSSSSSYSYSNSFSKDKTSPTDSVTAISKVGCLEKSRSGDFIAEYVKAFQKRYGIKSRPDLSGKVLGEIKRFLVGQPNFDRAVNLIQVYLQMNDKWFETKCHDFATFVANLQKVGLALDTGHGNESINWSKVFEDDKQIEAME